MVGHGRRPLLLAVAVLALVLTEPVSAVGAARSLQPRTAPRHHRTPDVRPEHDHHEKETLSGKRASGDGGARPADMEQDEQANGGTQNGRGDGAEDGGGGDDDDSEDDDGPDPGASNTTVQGMLESTKDRFSRLDFVMLHSLLTKQHEATEKLIAQVREQARNGERTAALLSPTRGGMARWQARQEKSGADSNDGFSDCWSSQGEMHDLADAVIDSLVGLQFDTCGKQKCRDFLAERMSCVKFGGWAAPKVNGTFAARFSANAKLAWVEMVEEWNKETPKDAVFACKQPESLHLARGEITEPGLCDPGGAKPKPEDLHTDKRAKRAFAISQHLSWATMHVQKRFGGEMYEMGYEAKVASIPNKKNRARRLISMKVEVEEYEEVMEQLIVGVFRDDTFRTVFASVFLGRAQCGDELNNRRKSSEDYEKTVRGTMRWVLGSEYSQADCLDIVQPVRKWIMAKTKQKHPRVFLEDMVSYWRDIEDPCRKPCICPEEAPFCQHTTVRTEGREGGQCYPDAHGNSTASTNCKGDCVRHPKRCVGVGHLRRFEHLFGLLREELKARMETVYGNENIENLFTRLQVAKTRESPDGVDGHILEHDLEKAFSLSGDSPPDINYVSSLIRLMISYPDNHKNVKKPWGDRIFSRAGHWMAPKAAMKYADLWLTDILNELEVKVNNIFAAMEEDVRGQNKTFTSQDGTGCKTVPCKTLYYVRTKGWNKTKLKEDMQGWLRQNMYGWSPELFETNIPENVQKAVENGNSWRAWTLFKKYLDVGMPGVEVIADLADSTTGIDLLGELRFACARKIQLMLAQLVNSVGMEVPGIVRDVSKAQERLGSLLADADRSVDLHASPTCGDNGFHVQVASGELRMKELLERRRKVTAISGQGVLVLLRDKCDAPFDAAKDKFIQIQPDSIQHCHRLPRDAVSEDQVTCAKVFRLQADVEGQKQKIRQELQDTSSDSLVRAGSLRNCAEMGCRYLYRGPNMCQCDWQCSSNGNCCDDYTAVCSESRLFGKTFKASEPPGPSILPPAGDDAKDDPYARVMAVLSEIVQMQEVSREQIMTLLVETKNAEEWTKIEKAVGILLFVLGDGHSASLESVQKCFKLRTEGSFFKIMEINLGRLIGDETKSQELFRLLELPEEMATYARIHWSGTVTADELMALSHGKQDPELERIVRAAFEVMGDGSSRLNLKDVLQGLSDKDWRREKGAKLLTYVKRAAPSVRELEMEPSGMSWALRVKEIEQDPEAALQRLVQSVRKPAEAHVKRILQDMFKMWKEEVLPVAKQLLRILAEGRNDVLSQEAADLLDGPASGLFGESEEQDNEFIEDDSDGEMSTFTVVENMRQESNKYLDKLREANNNKLMSRSSKRLYGLCLAAIAIVYLFYFGVTTLYVEVVEIFGERSNEERFRRFIKETPEFTPQRCREIASLLDKKLQEAQSHRSLGNRAKAKKKDIEKTRSYVSEYVRGFKACRVAMVAAYACGHSVEYLAETEIPTKEQGSGSDEDTDRYNQVNSTPWAQYGDHASILGVPGAVFRSGCYRQDQRPGCSFDNEIEPCFKLTEMTPYQEDLLCGHNNFWTKALKQITDRDSDGTLKIGWGGLYSGMGDPGASQKTEHCDIFETWETSVETVSDPGKMAFAEQQALLQKPANVKQGPGWGQTALDSMTEYLGLGGQAAMDAQLETNGMLGIEKLLLFIFLLVAMSQFAFSKYTYLTTGQNMFWKGDEYMHFVPVMRQFYKQEDWYLMFPIGMLFVSMLTRIGYMVHYIWFRQIYSSSIYQYLLCVQTLLVFYKFILRYIKQRHNLKSVDELQGLYQQYQSKHTRTREETMGRWFTPTLASEIILKWIGRDELKPGRSDCDEDGILDVVGQIMQDPVVALPLQSLLVSQTSLALCKDIHIGMETFSAMDIVETLESLVLRLVVLYGAMSASQKQQEADLDQSDEDAAKFAAFAEDASSDMGATAMQRATELAVHDQGTTEVRRRILSLAQTPAGLGGRAVLQSKPQPPYSSPQLAVDPELAGLGSEAGAGGVGQASRLLMEQELQSVKALQEATRVLGQEREAREREQAEAGKLELRRETRMDQDSVQALQEATRVLVQEEISRQAEAKAMVEQQRQTVKALQEATQALDAAQQNAEQRYVDGESSTIGGVNSVGRAAWSY